MFYFLLALLIVPHIFSSQTEEISIRKLEWTTKSIAITQHQKNCALLKAVQTQNISEIEMLLQNSTDIHVQDKADIDAQDKHGNTCLHIACAIGSEPIIEILLKKMAYLHIKNNEGDTPIHIACKKNQLVSLQWLCKTQLDLYNETNNNGYTPLHTACAHNHQEMVKFFCNRSWIDWKRTNKAGSNLLHTICQNNFVELFEIFVATAKKHPIDLLQLSDMIATENRFGLKPFFIACTKNHVEIVVSFIRHNKAELNEQQDDESTALHAAVGNDSNLVVSVLCNTRAMNINHQNASGSTALHIAVERGNSEIVRTLLEHRANTNITDNNDFIPLDIALSKKNNKIINLTRTRFKDLQKI